MIPNVVTYLRYQDAVFEILAYRSLSKEECKIALAYYKRENHLRKTPTTGKHRIVTTIGSIDE